jgi:hypothetical protein
VKNDLQWRLVSEAIEPDVGTMRTSRIARGQPDMPRLFTWRGRQHEVAAVLRSWKETSRCKSGADEQYVRKHWFHVRTTDGLEMKVYFERQPASRRERKARWWLYAVSDRGTDSPAPADH